MTPGEKAELRGLCEKVRSNPGYGREFNKAARTALPELLDELDEKDREIERLREERDQWRESCRALPIDEGYYE